MTCRKNCYKNLGLRIRSLNLFITIPDDSTSAEIEGEQGPFLRRRTQPRSEIISEKKDLVGLPRNLSTPPGLSRSPETPATASHTHTPYWSGGTVRKFIRPITLDIL